MALAARRTAEPPSWPRGDGRHLAPPGGPLKACRRDETGGALGDRDGGRLGKAADDARHHRRVGNPQAREAAYLKVRGHHRVRAGAHPCGTDGMEEGNQGCVDIGVDLRVGLQRRSGEQFDLWGLEDKITCPLLNIGGEGEGSLRTDAHRFYELLRGPKRDRLIKASEGGEAHCAVNNRNLANQIEFDFLDDVFSATA
jgi:hypothetical protein